MTARIALLISCRNVLGKTDLESCVMVEAVERILGKETMDYEIPKGKEAEAIARLSMVVIEEERDWKHHRRN